MGWYVDIVVRSGISNVSGINLLLSCLPLLKLLKLGIVLHLLLLLLLLLRLLRIRCCRRGCCCHRVDPTTVVCRVERFLPFCMEWIFVVNHFITRNTGRPRNGTTKVVFATNGAFPSYRIHLFANIFSPILKALVKLGRLRKRPVRQWKRQMRLHRGWLIHDSDNRIGRKTCDKAIHRTNNPCSRQTCDSR